MDDNPPGRVASTPFDRDLANAIFLFCLVLGGGLLLITVLLGEIVGGVFDALNPRSSATGS